MLALARAVARSFNALAMRALTTDRFGLTSSTKPFSRKSSYAIVASDEQDVPAAKHLGQKRIRLRPSSLKFRLVEHRIVDLSPQRSLQLGDRLVQVREVHPPHDQHRDWT